MKISADKTLFKGRLLVSDCSDEISDYDSAVKKNKVATKDSFNTSDSELSLSNISDKLRFFATETVSGKMINRRVYSNDSLQGAIKKNSWSDPYKKRVIKNHDNYGDYQVLGLVDDSFFVDLKGSNHFSSDASKPLPDNVRNFVIQDNKVGEGASVIELLPNSKFIDGLCDFENTIFSQSSAFEKALCSICGKDLFGEDCCDHWPDKKYAVPVAPNSDQYTNELCYPIMVGDRMPCEFSSVVTPANDTSILYIFDTQTNECFKADSIKDFREFFSKHSVSCSPSASDNSKNKNNVSDSFDNEFNKYKKLGSQETSSNEDNSTEKPEGEKTMLTDKQKANVIKTVKFSIRDSAVQEKIIPKIETMLNKDGADDDTVDLVLDFIELTASNLADTSSEKTEESNDNEESNDESNESAESSEQLETVNDSELAIKVKALENKLADVLKTINPQEDSNEESQKDSQEESQNNETNDSEKTKKTEIVFNHNFC